MNDFKRGSQGLFLTTVMAGVIAYLIIGKVNIAKYDLEYIFGWLLAAGVGFTNFFIANFSKSRNVKKFFLGAFILGPLSQVAYVAAACFVLRRFNGDAPTFFITFLITYFLLMSYHIGRLYVSDCKINQKFVTTYPHAQRIV